MNLWRVLLVVMVGAGLIGCGSAADEDDPAPQVTASSSASMSAPTHTPGVQFTPQPAPPEPVEETMQQPSSSVASQPAPAPVIVSCQMGMGPIETYWSDGSVTGYSDYCQSEHDRALQAEVEANTPLCDGTVCRYPNGAEVPDTNAVPLEPAEPVVVPYTCGYDVLCDDAGNVIPGPESGVQLGNGWTCAGNGCTRPYQP